MIHSLWLWNNFRCGTDFKQLSIYRKSIDTYYTVEHFTSTIEKSKCFYSNYKHWRCSLKSSENILTFVSSQLKKSIKKLWSSINWIQKCTFAHLNTRNKIRTALIFYLRFSKVMHQKIRRKNYPFTKQYTQQDLLHITH